MSGQELCNKFGVSRTAVWKAINQLKEAGYEIEAAQNRGYHLLSVPDRMDETELSSIRQTEWAGCETYYFDCIDSTNTKAKELAEDGHPTGTFVVADQQTAGKRLELQSVNKEIEYTTDKAKEAVVLLDRIKAFVSSFRLFAPTIEEYANQVEADKTIDAGNSFRGILYEIGKLLEAFKELIKEGLCWFRC